MSGFFKCKLCGITMYAGKYGSPCDTYGDNCSWYLDVPKPLPSIDREAIIKFWRDKGKGDIIDQIEKEKNND